MNAYNIQNIPLIIGLVVLTQSSNQNWQRKNKYRSTGYKNRAFIKADQTIYHYQNPVRCWSNNNEYKS